MKPSASRIERMLEKIEAKLVRRSGNGCMPSSTRETPRPW